MRYFSGFSLQNEKHIFRKFLKESEFNVAGFSYGSILAFEYVLKSKSRIDILQLFSPAFFQESSEKFIRLQLIYFQKDKDKYIDTFINNSFFPNQVLDNLEKGQSEYKDLEKLLKFKWNEKDFKKILDKGIEIEIFIGEKDKIVDSQKASLFFQKFGTLCFIKNVGHTLSG